MATTLRNDVRLAAKLFRGFADPTRLAIVEALAAEGELRVTDLVGMIGGSQANISGHVACLKDCGLIKDRPEGRQIFYSIADPAVIDVLRSAETVLALNGDRISLCPNYRRQPQ